MFLLLSLPITLTSVILYLFLILFGNSARVWWSGLIVSLLVIFFIFKNYFKNNPGFQKKISLRNLSLIFLILLFVFAKAYVLSPFALIKTTDSFKHIQITDVGDYYKHTFVVTMLKLDGIPPHHPYFPMAKLSYYFGYYLIPAAFSRLFNFAPNQVFYAFSLVTDILGLLIIFRIINKVIKTYWGKLVALLLLITGVGVNVVPEILDKFPVFGYKISPDTFSTETGFQLINNYKALLFVPQHFFAACLTIGLIYYLVWEKPSFFTVSITAAFIFLSSLFVSWTLSLWLFLIFIFYRQKRLFLILAGVISLLLLLPYIAQLSDRENIFRFNVFRPYQFIKDNGLANFLNIFLTALIQYGLILCALPLIVIFRGRTFLKKNLRFILALFLPFVATWFIRSPFFNDFSLRGLMPIQLILPVFFIRISEQSGKFLKTSMFLLSILVIVLGYSGFYLEYSRHWKNRFILNPSTSKMLIEVRKIPNSTKLSAIDRDRWVEFIPSLGFKKILSPYLFDSYVYFVGKLTAEHGQYERLALDLFMDPNIARDTKTLVAERNIQLDKVHDFFDRYKADLLILNNQLWVKKDINPWLAAVLAMGVDTKSLTGDYTLVDYPSLLEKTAQYRISIQENKGIALPIKDKAFPLKSGLWYLSACSTRRLELHFELEDYYLLFDQEADGSSRACVGKMFYLQKDENVRLTNNSNIEEVFAFPIAISALR